MDYGDEKAVTRRDENARETLDVLNIINAHVFGSGHFVWSGEMTFSAHKLWRSTNNRWECSCSEAIKEVIGGERSRMELLMGAAQDDEEEVTTIQMMMMMKKKWGSGDNN